MNTDLVGIVYEYLRFNDQIKLYKLDKFMYYNLARNVELFGGNFNDEILKQKRFKNVYKLNLGWNEIITDEGIKYMNLHTLDLYYNKNITDKRIKHMNLHTLNLNWNKTITDDGIKHMNLYTMNLWGNKNITDEGIKHMNLHTLDSHHDKI